MIKRSLIVLFHSICLWGMSICLVFAQSNSWKNIFPKPDAQNIAVQTTLLFQPTQIIPNNFDPHILQISVQGARSGSHEGQIIISDDSKTVIFKLELPFTPGETVAVKVNAGPLGISPLEYQFRVSEIPEYNPSIWAGASDDLRIAKGASIKQTYGTRTVINGVAVPSDFPIFKATTLKGTDKGKIFIGNWSWSGDRQYMMILENDGTPYFYQRLPGAHTRDFKVQPTRTMTRRVYDNLNCFVEMNSQYTIIDTLRCGDGLGTDEHECQLLPDHHYFLIGLDYQQKDMSKLISGGSTNATIIGNTVQELDRNHNVVFRWRSWDNFDVTDANHEDLRGGTIDYVHMNSIAIDYDSNIVISSRHLSEVTKIDRKTGVIIWRFGGLHNQFTLVNDAYGLSYQHDARPVPGIPNHYTVFDDGNYHSPQFSRAVEFELDTATMTAKKVWEYRHKPSDYYAYFMGNVQRLPNGNTFIDWADAPLPKASEVTPLGDLVYEANFEKSAYAYRSFRFDWESVVKIPYLVVETYINNVSLIFNKFGDKSVKRYIIYGGLLPHSTTPLDSTSNTWIDLTNLTSNKYYYFRVTARDSNGVESQFSNEENTLVRMVNPGDNLVLNGDFSTSTANWQFSTVNGANATNRFMSPGEIGIFIKNGGTQRSNVQLYQTGIPLENGKSYFFEFDAHATKSCIIAADVEQSSGSYTNYSRTSTLSLTPTQTHKSFHFTMNNLDDANSRVIFYMGLIVDTIYIDNISLKEDVGNDVEDSPVTPDQFILNQNYPNPFNPNTTISYQLPGAGIRYMTTIQVFDQLGRKVATLLNEEKFSGKHIARWNAAGCASGVYFCKLSAFGRSNGKTLYDVKKILLIK